MKQNGSPGRAENTIAIVPGAIAPDAAAPGQEKTERPDTGWARRRNWRKLAGIDDSKASRFRLLGYFSVTSAIVLAFVIGVLVVLERQMATAELLRMTERQNVALAQSFANSISGKFSAYVDSAAGLDADALRVRSETHEIHQALKTLPADSTILKVKIINEKGLVVYSSAFEEIGADESARPSFLAAVRDLVPVTKFAHKKDFGDVSGVFFGRDIIETYIPIRRGGGPIEGVLEVYLDVTLAIESIDRVTGMLSVGMLIAFGIIYALLFLIFRHAEHVVTRQYAGIEHSMDVIDAKNFELVRENSIRTRAERQLATVNEKLEAANKKLNLRAEQLETANTILEKTHHKLEDRVKSRTKELEIANAELHKNQVRLFGLQENLNHMSRLGTMGVMAAELAHEINQPLAAVANYANGSLLRMKDKPMTAAELMPVMKTIAGQALRAGAIIHALSGFMSRAAPKKEPIDLRRMIDEVRALFAGKIREGGIDVFVRVPPSPPPVMADKIQIQQVLVNLVQNALMVFDGNNTAKPRLEIEAAEKGDGTVEICVQDNGTGIGPDIIDKIFDPFFTTRAGGAGMGLSICRSIVAGHEGHLWATSGPGAGACFRFTLPVDLPVIADHAAFGPGPGAQAGRAIPSDPATAP